MEREVRQTLLNTAITKGCSHVVTPSAKKKKKKEKGFSSLPCG
jgi:hypothetical protein